MIEKAIFVALIFPGFLLGTSPVVFVDALQTAFVIDPTTMSALAAAVVGALTSYIVAARRFSGKIETTEAKELSDAESTGSRRLPRLD